MSVFNKPSTTVTFTRSNIEYTLDVSDAVYGFSVDLITRERTEIDVLSFDEAILIYPEICHINPAYPVMISLEEDLIAQMEAETEAEFEAFYDNYYEEDNFPIVENDLLEEIPV